jgi:carbon monoxide dehydrogenase subunit G
VTRLTSEILIDKPAPEVFAFLNTAENHARFIPGMREFRKTSPGPFGAVGATARGRRSDLGFKSDVSYEITAVDPGRRLDMQGRMGPIRFRDGYLLEPRSGHTRVTFWLELSLDGLMKLAGPFIALIGRTHAAETLANLKKAVENDRRVRLK